MTSFIFQHPLFKSCPKVNDEQGPFDLILGEHYRQRLLVTELLDLSTDLRDPFAPATARLIHYHLLEKRCAQENFEDEAMVPLLRQRCQPGDNLKTTVTKMAWDRLMISKYAQKIQCGLISIANGEKIPDVFEFRGHVRKFAFALKDHIVWKNREIIPLARLRLNAADLAHLLVQLCRRERQELWPALAT